MYGKSKEHHYEQPGDFRLSNFHTNSCMASGFHTVVEPTSNYQAAGWCYSMPRKTCPCLDGFHMSPLIAAKKVNLNSPD